MNSIAAIKPDDQVSGVFRVVEARLAPFRDGSKGRYMHLLLADGTGQVEGRLWEDAEQAAAWLAPGDVIQATGRAMLYEGRIQLHIDSIEPASKDVAGLSGLLPAPIIDLSEALAVVHAAVGRVGQQPLQALLAGFLGDGDFVNALSLAPLRRPGELLETISALLELAAPLRHVAPDLNHDLLTAAIVLHGIGATMAASQSHGGRAVARLGVAALSDQLLSERLAQRPDFPADLAIDLRHCILASHDPAMARTREAAVLAALRNLTAAVNSRQ